MEFHEFLDTLDGPAPPSELDAPLVALWWARRGEWDRAHEIVQDLDGPDAAWIHAHLHREEGDPGNAGYWYRRAGRTPASGELAAEWEDIARKLLERGA